MLITDRRKYNNGGGGEMVAFYVIFQVDRNTEDDDVLWDEI